MVLATQLSIGFSHTCRPGNSTYVDVPTRCRSPTWSCGVPQGSVLAPILFVLYTVDILRVTDSHGLSAHMYADDTQVYGFCRPIAVTALTVNITDCVEAATSSMRSNRLQPNPDKTEMELLWCATARRQHQRPTSPLQIDGCSITVTPVQSAHDRHLYVDCDLSMRTHVQRTVSRCFAALRQLRQIRRSVPSATLQMLMLHWCTSRLDYGNGVQVGLPAYLTRRLRSVLNAVARLIYRLRTRDHISDALISLYWLRVLERTHYKLAVLVYKVLHGDARRYIGSLTRVDDLPGQQTHRSNNANLLVVQPVKLSTVGSRAFAVAAPRIWNTLPTDVVAAIHLPLTAKTLLIQTVISKHHLLTSSS